MKTSVTKIMMSFALMGCLIFSASDAMAQGRSRSQGGSSSSRSQSAAVSRSNSSAAPQVSRSSSSSSSRSQAAPQVNRSSSSSSSRSQAAPQVNRSSSSSSSRSQATPQVNRSNSTTSRSQTSPQVNRSNPTTGAPTSVERRSDTRPSTVTTPSSGTPNRSNSSSHSSGSRNQGHGNGNGTIDRGGNSSGQSGSGHVTPLDNKTKHTTSRTGMTDDRTKASSPNSTTGTRVGKPGGDKPGGNGGGKPNGGNGGGKPNGGVSGGNHGDKPGGGHGNEGHGKRPNDKGNGHKGNDRHGFDSRNHYDYTGHHYRHDFHRNYTHHNWSRPLPPPARPYRPAPIVWYRPVIPAGWTPYYGAPVIDRILGITFGTLFDVSLDYLYYNGYYIDGYADNIIYLREVPLLNLIWDDVMLCYDSSSRLVNAQFIIQSASYNTYRYDRVYRNLCRVYGNPVARTSEGISWYGGNSTGWVTLSMHNNLGHYYTTLSIGY